MNKARFLVALNCGFLAVCPIAHAIQTDNFGLRAVPRSGPIVIDGKLDDWDLSGQILMTYDMETLKDVYSARISTMYDADNLYIGIQWKDPIPLGNSHDPRYNPGKAWAGDAAQIRIKTDRITHLTAWYYAPKQEPAITISYGKSLTEPFGGGEAQLHRTQGNQLAQGAEMGFLKDTDGRGYVQEIKIPWKIITDGKSYKAGDKFSMGFELLWGESDWPVHRYADNLQPGSASREFFWTAHDAWGSVTLEPKGQLKLPEPAYLVAYNKLLKGETSQGPVDIAYDLPQNARVTLAIDDTTGKRIRNLVPALPRTKGRNVEKWDGLDDNGTPVPPGKYAYKILYHDGVRANYVMSFANPGSPTWNTPDGSGSFYADHSAPQAVAARGKYIALGAPLAEAGFSVIGTDLNGKKLWGLANRGSFYAGRVSLSTDEKTLWIAQDKTGTIYRVDMATGKYSPWNQANRDESGKDFQTLDLKVTDKISAEWNSPINLTSIALNNNTLAVAFALENKIKLIEAQTGALKREISIPAPQSIAANGSNWLVLSEGRLVSIDAAGAIKPFATSPLTDAYGLTTDTRGNVYVSIRGQQQQVKVFSPEGKWLRDIGEVNGRDLVGPYNANGMRNPAGIAIDSQNRLWVTEETNNPKRTSVWDTQSGKLLKDLPGTTTYSGAGGIDPADPTLGYSDNTIYRINLQTGAWKPEYSLGKIEGVDDIFPSRADSRSRVIHQGASTYLFTSDRTNGVRCTVLHNGRWRAAAYIGLVKSEIDPEVNTDFKFPPLQEHVGELVVWTDTDGGGTVDRSELTFIKPSVDGKPATLTGTYWGTLPDENGTISFIAMEENALVKFPISRFLPNGAPVYDAVKQQVVRVDKSIPMAGTAQMIMGGKNGRVYINQDPLTAIDANGKVLFTYPSRHVSVHGSHTAKAARPGYLIGPSSFLGTADMGGDIGEVFYLNGNLGENYLFTHDGLYIQSLFKDTRGYFDTPLQAVRGMSADAMTAGGESFGGNFVKIPNGKTYVTLGSTDARVFEVTGLQDLKRLNGTFTYSPIQYAQAQTAMLERIAQDNAPKTFEVARAVAGPAIDGNPADWPELLEDNSRLLEIQDSPTQRFGRVAMRYDDNNLYVGYRVFAPRGAMANAGQDARLLFKTGDVVDLMIGPDRENVGAAIAGDTRILLSSPANTPIAVLNQKVAPNAPANEKFGFSSPWRTITFDRVAEVPSVAMKTAPIREGYFVEASIPWNVLGVTPKTGLKLRGDVGVLFADNGGSQTVSRQYWSNKATGLVNDVPGEADLTPSLWGTFTLR